TNAVKKSIAKLQDLYLALFFTKVGKLKLKGCALDPKIYLTPFKLIGKGYARDHDKAAILRESKWTYNFLNLPYFLSITYSLQNLESLSPSFTSLSEEKLGTLSSLSSSQ